MITVKDYVVAALLGIALGFVCAWLFPINRSLPHRPLSEIDIQGHQPAVAPGGDPCPGQYGYWLANGRVEVGPNEIIVYCWGQR